MGKWSGLPVDLLELIEDCLVLYADKVRIRTVCLSWYLQLSKLPNRQFPWLLQALDDNIEASHTLFNPIDKKFYFLDLQNLLQNKIFKGSSHGWVATLEDTKNKNNKQFSHSIYLINPLTSARIELPSRNKFPDIARYHPDQLVNEYLVKYGDGGDWIFHCFCSFETVNNRLMGKIVMSSDPSKSDGEDCIIVAIYGSYQLLACCTLNDKRWRPRHFKDMDDGDITITSYSFLDIIFRKGKLHALVWGDRQVIQVLVFENINCVKPNPNVTVIATHIRGVLSIRRYPDFAILTEDYLVESSDASCLMIVERFLRFDKINSESDGIPHTLYFKVYKVDQVNRTSVELKSIGDDVLILGMNTSTAISSRNSIGYKGNHIYFTDSHYSYECKRSGQEDSTIGVFNLEDQTLQPLCGFKSKPKFLWPPPIWVNVS